MTHNWENYFDISSECFKKVEKIYEDSESFPKKVVKLSLYYIKEDIK